MKQKKFPQELSLAYINSINNGLGTVEFARPGLDHLVQHLRERLRN